MKCFFTSIKALPVLLIGLIYFPSSLLGLILFNDRESIEVLILVLLFSLIYFSSYGLFSRVFIFLAQKTATLVSTSGVVWYRLSLVAFCVYVISVFYTVHLADAVPAMVALKGGTLMNIAQARGQFLAGLEGYESLLRYAVFILGRSVMPLVLVAAFVFNSKFRYLLLIALLVLSMLSLEKAAPVFIFLPCIFYFFVSRKFLRAVLVSFLMVVSIGIMTHLAMGGVGDARIKGENAELKEELPMEVSIPPGLPIQEAMGRPGRFFLPNMIQDQFGVGQVTVEANELSGKLIILLNRIVWIPYITAYDWLGFHRKVLDGKLTLGRSISFVHLLFGEPKMMLEKMVYVYEFGPSPGGAGAANTVFFIDAKLAFGWAGVVVYCLIFTFCSACIFSSGNQLLMVSSIVCFFVASVSSLTATLLSGGLFIYVVLAFLLFEGRAAVPILCKTGDYK